MSRHSRWDTLANDAGLVKVRMELKQHPKAQPDAAGVAEAA
ncbi:hypothetical protein [Streptomyces exfoliatus]|nr:hypothetical protein [Streptomyces exfoliatus]